jgi:signal transduction histidine kinase
MLSNRRTPPLELLAAPVLALLLVVLAALQFHWLEQWALRDAESREVALATLAQGLVAEIDAEVERELARLRAIGDVWARSASEQPALAPSVETAPLWWVARDPRRTARPVWRLRAGPQPQFVEAGLAELLQQTGRWGERLLRGVGGGPGEIEGLAPMLLLELRAAPAVAEHERGFLLQPLSPDLFQQALQRALRQSERSRAGVVRAQLLPANESDAGILVPTPARFAGQPVAGYWRLQLRYSGGSARELAAQLQRGHLLLAGSILLLLAVSATLLGVAAYRRRRLAEQRLLTIATVSHELRTPLAVIDSAAANLADGITAEPARVREYGALIRNEAQRLQRWVEQALEPGVLADGAAAPVRAGSSAIGASLQRCFDDLQIDPERLRLDLGNLADVVVALPAADLDLVLSNLIGNALSYADAGSPIWLRLQRRGRRLELRLCNRCGTLRPDERGRLLEPFFRAEHARSQRRHGSGLGLSLVRAVLQRHRGRLKIGFADTLVDVRVTLPLHNPGRP